MTTEANANAHARPAPVRILLALAALVLVLLVATVLLASLRIGDRALARGVASGAAAAPAGTTPADSGLAYDEVPMRARDGTRLSGWWIRPGDGVRRPDLAVVVLAHGTDETREDLLPVAVPLCRAGFLVLALDLRAHGASEGDLTTGGFLETEDVAAGVGLAHERAIGAPVLVFGQGSGAIAAARAAARDVTVRAVCFASPARTFEQSLLRRPEVARDPLRAFALPPLVRARMASVVGRGYRPGDQAFRDMPEGLRGRTSGTFAEAGHVVQFFGWAIAAAGADSTR